MPVPAARGLWAVASALLLLSGHAGHSRDRKNTTRSLTTRSLATVGVASFYSWYFNGRLMADGRPFMALGVSAASRTLPLGSWVRVRNRHNGRVVVLQITDRGPYVAGRIIDLSLGAARLLGMERAGLQLVEITPLASPVPAQP